MTDIILVYITCQSVKQAKEIGHQLLDKKLSTCVNIFPEMHSMYLWPPKSGQIEENSEVVLLVKTIKSKFRELSELVTQIHTYDTPCIISIPVTNVSEKYGQWIVGELTPSK